ncbi:hypothetical protein BJV82DRAFT_211684 [Fennellomyces sp. T-0311]|nr:hypothetical protein BJV82DRAFT_211684 [Fennellomyces sp. T-0311]
MFYYDNGNSNSDHHGNRPIPTNHHHNKDKGSHVDGDPFQLYLQHSDPSSGSQSNAMQHQSTTDSSLYFPFNSNDAAQSFDSSYLNDPLLSLAGQEYDMHLARGLDEQEEQDRLAQDLDTHRDLSAYLGWNQPNQNAFFSQQQHQQQHLSLSPDNRQHEAEAAILNAFTALGQRDQQAILFSDPNFVRQQQLLQEQQRMMYMRQEEEDSGIANGMHETEGDADTSATMRSNLSAMLDETSSDGKADKDSNYNDINVTSSHQAPSLDSSFAAADRTRLSFSPATPAPEARIQQTWEQPTFNKMTKLQQKRSSGSAANARSKRTSSPIPIKGIMSHNSRPVSSSVPSEVDHQRRQNELQARFRVTYARKPGNQQTIQKPSGRSAAIATPSSFSGSSAAHVQPSTLGTSVPTFSTTSDFDNDFIMSSPQISLTPDPSLQGSASPSRKGQDTKGGGNNARSASKSPSTTNQTVNFPSRTMPIQIQRVQRASVPQPLDAEQHQRKLDEQLEKVNFDDITVSELKDMLRQRGKPATGKKAVLLQRLQDERELIRAVKSGKAHRHSQPPLSSMNKSSESGRPLSYQGSSPLTTHASVATLPQSPLLAGSPSSMPNSSMFLPPGSPGSVTHSLNRSIANMHIGSPPQHPRRYSPYATPGSPRMSSASPKLQPQSSAYSSSMPINAVSSSPGSLSNGSPLSSSFTSRARPSYHNTYGTNGRPKTYAPFTSSALATPDRDDDRDPFDDFAMGQTEDCIKQEDTMSMRAEPIKMEGVDTDPAGSSFLRNANISDTSFDFDIPDGFTREDVLAVLAGQGFGDPTVGLQSMEGSGYMSTDMGATADMMLFDHLENFNRYHESQQGNGSR